MTKIKSVLQSEHSECGIASVTSVLNYFKLKVSINDLRDKYGNSRGGLTFQNMQAILKDFGLSYRGIKVSDLEILKKIKKPSILFWENKHFVVLYKCKNKHFYIMDPKIGKIILSEKEFGQSFSSCALVFDYFQSSDFNNSFSINNNKPKNLVTELLNSNKILIGLSILFILFSKILSLIVPFITQRIVDNYSSLLSIPFSYLVFLILVLAISYYLITVLHSLFLTKLQINWNKKISESFMSKIFLKTLNFFINRSSGSMIYKANLISMMQQLLSKNTIENVIDYFFMVIYFFVLLNYSAKLTLLTIAVCIAVLCNSIFYSKINYKINSKVMEYQSELQSSYVEIFSGIETIKSLGKENRFYSRWSDIFEKSLNGIYQQGKLAAWLSSISNALIFILPILILVFGINEIQDNNMSLGQLIGFTTLVTYFISPFTTLIASITQLLVLKSYINQISDVTNNEFFNETSGKVKIDRFSNLEVDSLNFSFSLFEDNIVSVSNLNIKKGEKIAIVGRSGSGKSTLLKLICNLYETKNEKVLYNETNVKKLEKESFRSKIGYVTQNSIVFGNTLAENLMLENAPVELVNEILEITGINEFMSGGSFGLNTIISENGMNLSGGQKQKIAIARCLLKNPDLIIMDEPTSSLDNISEKKIMDYILNSDKTFIIVAHRLNTIKNMDRIIVLEKGAVIEQGRHDDLMNNNSYYSYLYNET